MGEPWFGAKTYGIGLSPKGPAGWIALALYVAVIAATAPVCRRLGAPDWAPAAAWAGLTVVFLVVALIKSDRQPWRWRWGGR